MVTHRTGVPIPGIGPNLFYEQLIANLAAYGGGAPTLRVGGNYQDLAWWDPSGVVTDQEHRDRLWVAITRAKLEGLALNARITGQRMILGLELGGQ